MYFAYDDLKTWGLRNEVWIKLTSISVVGILRLICGFDEEYLGSMFGGGNCVMGTNVYS